MPSKNFLAKQEALLKAMLYRLSSSQDKITQSGAGDFADLSSEITEIEQSLSSTSNRHQICREIQHALKKIDSGGYGICEATGKAIGEERLQAIPWTRFSVEAQAEFERSSVRGKHQLFDQVLEETESEDEPDESKAS